MRSYSSNAPSVGDDRELRRDLVNSGAAEEIVKVLASYGESMWGLPERSSASTLSADLDHRMEALSTEDSAKGYFSSGLAEVTQGCTIPLLAAALSAENGSLRNRVSELEEALASRTTELLAKGYVEMVCLSISEIKALGIPDMDAGASLSDPFLEFSVEGPERTLEYAVRTAAKSNAEGEVEWDDSLELRFPLPKDGEELSVRITLWDDDLGNADDFMGRNDDVDLEQGSSGGREEDVLLKPSGSVRIREGSGLVPTKVSFTWSLLKLGFEVPPEPKPRAEPATARPKRLMKKVTVAGFFSD